MYIFIIAKKELPMHIYRLLVGLYNFIWSTQIKWHRQIYAPLNGVTDIIDK